MYSLYNNLGDPDYLQEVCDDLNFLGNLRAALAIAQKVRALRGLRPGQSPLRLRECLVDQSNKVRDTIKALGLTEPSTKEVMKAIEDYKMFSAAELAAFQNEIAD